MSNQQQTTERIIQLIQLLLIRLNLYDWLLTDFNLCKLFNSRCTSFQRVIRSTTYLMEISILRFSTPALWGSLTFCNSSQNVSRITCDWTYISNKSCFRVPYQDFYYLVWYNWGDASVDYDWPSWLIVNQVSTKLDQYQLLVNQAWPSTSMFDQLTKAWQSLAIFEQ